MEKRFLWVIAGWIFCHYAAAYDVLVNINGAIAANGCMVSFASQQMTLDFGNVATKQFYARDIPWGKQKFVIGLERCGGDATAVKVSFQGAADTDNADLLKLTPEEGIVKGLAIEILDVNSASIAINTQTSAFPISQVEGNNKLLFYAQYRSTASTVTAGPANATVNFVLEYQ
ncbi:fimbrial protein [Pseudomonas sp. D47]|uniref:fimbrial protein n=1 Tax=Pseudomonas sp. D47 TaxID=3159447 RepID=UPI00387AAE01